MFQSRQGNTEQNAQDVALSVYQTLVGRKENDIEYVPTMVLRVTASSSN